MSEEKIISANENRFTAGNYSEALTAFTVGWRDPENIAELLDFIAPPVPVGRRFEFKRSDNAQAFYSENDDVRAVGAEFKRAADTSAAFLAEKFGWTALACDRRRIISAYGKKHGVFSGKDITLKLSEIVAGYKPVFVVPTAALGESAEEYSACFVCPVTGAKGPEGALIALSDEDFSESETRIIELCARIVANNMQKC